jgi:hypothetical protein
MKKVYLSLLLLAFASGCSKESITPAYSPKTLQQQQTSQFGNESIQISLSMEDLEVDEFGGDIGDVPVVGSVFQRLAGMFADISIDDENGTEVVIDPTYFELAELEQIDFNYIKGVGLDKVHLRVANDDMDGASLSFIKRIEVYINVDPVIPDRDDVEDIEEDGSGTIRPSNEEDEEVYEELIVKDDTEELPWYHLESTKSVSREDYVLQDYDQYYYKDYYKEKKSDDLVSDSILALTYDKDRDTLGCFSKCLDMRVQPVDWRKILMKARSFSIEIKLVVDSVPKAKLELGGEIKFSVTVNAGF